MNINFRHNGKGERTQTVKSQARLQLNDGWRKCSTSAGCGFPLGTGTALVEGFARVRYRHTVPMQNPAEGSAAAVVTLLM